MISEPEAGNWHVQWDCGDESPSILDQSNNLIARIEKTRQEVMLPRAGLIMTAPELYESVAASLYVFQAIAEHGEGNAVLAAKDMIPMLESVLDGANSLGKSPRNFIRVLELQTETMQSEIDGGRL